MQKKSTYKKTEAGKREFAEVMCSMNIKICNWTTNYIYSKFSC